MLLSSATDSNGIQGLRGFFNYNEAWFRKKLCELYPYRGRTLRSDIPFCYATLKEQQIEAMEYLPRYGFERLSWNSSSESLVNTNSKNRVTIFITETRSFFDLWDRIFKEEKERLIKETQEI